MVVGDDAESFAERHLPGLRVGGGSVHDIPRERMTEPARGDEYERELRESARRVRLWKDPG